MNDNTTNTNTQLIFLGAAVAAPNGQYAIKKPALVGFHAYFMCPKCGRPVMLMPQNEGFSTFSCKNCNTGVIIKSVTKDKIMPKTSKTVSGQNVKKEHPSGPQTANASQNESGKQQTKQPQSNPQKTKTERFGASEKTKVNARIVWGGLISRKSYSLREGENWIGRWDEEEPSDIMVKDEYMSRRSALVEVIRQNGEFLFKFTVKRCTNAVKVNGKTMEVNQCVYLNYEDRIEMGSTTLFVKKEKNK